MQSLCCSGNFLSEIRNVIKIFNTKYFLYAWIRKLQFNTYRKQDTNYIDGMKVKSELNLQKKFKKKISLNKDKKWQLRCKCINLQRKDLIYANN
jgi:hypothetical protein